MSLDDILPANLEYDLENVKVTLGHDANSLEVVFPDAWKVAGDEIQARNNFRKLITKALAAGHMEPDWKQNDVKSSNERDVYTVSVHYKFSNKHPTPQEMLDQIASYWKEREPLAQKLAGQEGKDLESLTVRQFLDIELPASHLAKARKGPAVEAEKREKLYNGLADVVMDMAANKMRGVIEHDLPLVGYLTRGLVDIAIDSEAEPKSAANLVSDPLIAKIANWMKALNEAPDAPHDFQGSFNRLAELSEADMQARSEELAATIRAIQAKTRSAA